MTGGKVTFNVMTMNLRFGLADDGDNSWENRKKAYPGLFSTHSPDFIGVQEANDFQTAYLTSLLKDHGHVGERTLENGPVPKSWQDNVIFYRNDWACIKHGHYFLSGTPNVQSTFPESKWPRQCSIGHFVKNGQELIHVNTHFDFDAGVQEKSAQVVIRLLREFPEGIPTVITGDFNASPGSRAYGLFLEHGFTDIFKGGHTSTFHGFTGRNLGGHIDWILFRGGIECEDPMIIREKFSGIHPSDHYPVVSVFRFL
jgi:endonuclease/exonuclease/phosphatase family metal-dependent hydrolase